MCTTLVSASMPLDDDAWKRLPYYAYYDAAPYYGAAPVPTTSTFTPQPPQSRPLNYAPYHAPTPTPTPTTYPSYPPHTAYPAPYPAPPHPRGTTAHYHLYPQAMPSYAVEPSRPVYPVASRDVSMLTIPIYESDLDEIRMLQEMLLTPYPGDDEAKESSHVAMLLAANESIVALATTTATTPTTLASAPTTPLSEVSSCDSQRISLASETSPRTSSTNTRSGNTRARSIPPSRICRVPDCTKGIRSRGLCKAHGGGRRCQTPGCSISDQGGGHCIAHGGGKRCTTSGCDKSAQFRGLCKVHGGSRRCRVTDCDKNGQINGLCRHHYTQSLQGQTHGSSDHDESDHRH